MLEVATRGYLTATRHRVASPPPGVDRYSVPFFLGPRLDAVVEPVDLPPDARRRDRRVGPERGPRQPPARRLRRERAGRLAALAPRPSPRATGAERRPPLRAKGTFGRLRAAKGALRRNAHAHDGHVPHDRQRDPPAGTCPSSGPGTSAVALRRRSRRCPLTPARCGGAWRTWSSSCRVGTSTSVGRPRRSETAASPPPVADPPRGDTAMPVEFLGIAATHDGSETTPRSGAAFDKEYTLRLARAHEDHGWDRVLFAYGSGSPDPAPAAAYIASRPDRLQILLAHRPNVVVPDLRREDVRHPRPDQRRPGHRALHHRRQRPRAGPRGRHPHQGRPLRPHPRVHPDRQAGRGPSTSPSTTTASTTRFDDFVSRRLPASSSRVRRVLRRLVARGVRRRRRRGRHLLPLGRAAGRHRRADRDGARRRRGGGPHRRADGSRWRSGRSSAADRGGGVGEGPRDGRARSRTHARAGRDAHQPPRRDRPRREHRLAAAARRRRARASATTAPCGPPPRRPPAARATPTRWSAPPRPSPPPCWTTTTSASTSSRPAATTCWPTPIEFGRAGDPDRPRGGGQARRRADGPRGIGTLRAA